jgi:hypothetical protein
MVSAIKEKLSSVKPSQVHDAPKVPDQRDRHHDGGNERRAEAVQENIDHQDDHQDRHHQGLLDLPQRGANGDGAVLDDHHVDLGIDRGLELRQLRLDRIDHLDDVGAGLLEHLDRDGGLAVVEAVRADVLGGAVLHVEHRARHHQAHGARRCGWR